jgi:hypothetical protein
MCGVKLAPCTKLSNALCGIAQAVMGLGEGETPLPMDKPDQAHPGPPRDSWYAEGLR